MREWCRLLLAAVVVAGGIAGPAALVGGCARYEYRLVEPADLAAPVPDEEELSIPRPPLRYAFQDLDGLLGLSIINEGDAPLRLSGERSYIVDPGGETHPLQGRLIAPAAHVSFAIPRQRERYRVYSTPHPSPYYYDPLRHRRYYYPFAYYHEPFDAPYAYDVYAPPTIYDWRWTTGPARLHLVYEPQTEDAEATTHDFVIERVRVK